MSIIKANQWQKTNGTVVGTVLQTIQVQDNTFRGTSSDALVDSGFSATITPTSSSSKILIIMGISLYVSSPTANSICAHSIYRNTTQLMTTRTSIYNSSGNIGDAFWGQNHITWLDSPNTTSATTYKYYWGRWSSSYPNSVNMNDGGTPGSVTGRQYSTITLLEIQA